MASKTRGGWRLTPKSTIYIRCSVPCCNSNTQNSAKFFVKVPFEPALRVCWFEIAKIVPYLNQFDEEIYFCQDHFDVDFKGNISDPAKFECQYFMEELDQINGSITTVDGICTDLLCSENCTETISPLSPILASCSPERQTQDSDSEQQFSYSLNDKERTFSCSEERSDTSSDILRSASFRPDIIEIADPEPQISQASPLGTPKLPMLLKNAVPHNALNDRHYKHEPAGTNVVKMTDDVIQNVNHDHYYILKPTDIFNLILSGKALKDHNYAKVNCSRKQKKYIKRCKKKIDPLIKCFCCQKVFYWEIDLLKHFQEQHVVYEGGRKAWVICSHCKKRFYRKSDLLNHLAIHHESRSDNESTDSADSIPTITCNYCNLEYSHRASLLNHIKKDHSVKKDEIEIWKYEYYQSKFIFKENSLNHLKIELAVGKERESAKSKEILKCYDKEYNLKEDLPIHIQDQHLDILKESPGVQERHLSSYVSMQNGSLDIQHGSIDMLEEFQDNLLITKQENVSKNIKNQNNFLRVINDKQDVTNIVENSNSAENKPTLKCYCCEKEFDYNTDLIKHFQEQHPDVQTKPKGIEEEDILEGSKFQFQNKTKDAEVNLKIKCCCKTIFQRKNDWYLHFQELHVEDIGYKNRKPYRCNHCGVFFKRQFSLTRHVSRLQSDNESTDSADSVKTYACNFCNLEYYHKGYLHTHIKNKHTVKKEVKLNSAITILKCKYCLKEYKRKLCLLKHIQREHVVSKNKYSENASQKFEKEFSSERYMLSQFQDRQLDIQEQPLVIEEDHLSRSSTQNESSDIKQDSLDKQDESLDIQDEPLDMQQVSQDLQEEPLDIKPEVFQCSKCPCSCLNAEEMSTHLQIMHGDLIDKLNLNERCAKVNKNTSSLLLAKECENDDKSQTALQDIYSGYNFAELETDIKKEFSNPLEDIHLPHEQQLGLNFVLDSDFSENEYNNYTNVQGANDTEFTKDSYPSQKDTNFNLEIVTIKTERLESENDLCNNHFDIISGQNENYSCVSPETKCKNCQITFPNQEELLDHIHDLINTKAKLYADAKQVLKTNCVQFKDPNAGFDKPFLNESELLDNIHRVYDKSEKKQFNLETVGENRIEVEENDCVKSVDPSVCRCCSKRLPIRIRIGKYDKICIKCKRIEKQNEKRRNSVKTQLYACAKNKQFKQPSDFESGTCENKPKTLSDLEILKNMNKYFNKRLNKMNQSSNNSKINCIDNEMDVKNDSLEGTFIFEDNDLLKPLREEEEKIIIVQPHDPKLCKGCLVPLEVTESTGQNKTINMFCHKCKASETCNEKCRKSNKKRRKSNGNQIGKTFSKRNSELSCLICRCKFRNKLALRKHVARSHI